MHSQLPRSPEYLLLSKGRRSPYQPQNLIHKQEEVSNTIMEERSSSQSISDLTEPGGSLSTSPSSTPSSTPSTPSCESAEWEQLSTTGTDQSMLSAEFEVLKGYNRVPIYERRAQWLAEQQARREQKLQPSPRNIAQNEPKAFRPNSQLPFPITAQFLRYYGGNGRSWEQRRSPQSDDSQRTIVTSANQFYTPTKNTSIPIPSPSSPESDPEVPPPTRRRELKEGKRSRPSPPSRKTSGIPSFTSLFKSKWDLGLSFHLSLSCLNEYRNYG